MVWRQGHRQKNRKRSWRLQSMRNNSGRVAGWDTAREARLRWLGHVWSRDVGYLGRRIPKMKLPRKRKSKRLKISFMDRVRDGHAGCWCEEDAESRKRWKWMIQIDSLYCYNSFSHSVADSKALINIWIQKQKYTRHWATCKYTHKHKYHQTIYICNTFRRAGSIQGYWGRLLSVGMADRCWRYLNHPEKCENLCNQVNPLVV